MNQKHALPELFRHRALQQIRVFALVRLELVEEILRVHIPVKPDGVPHRPSIHEEPLQVFFPLALKVVQRDGRFEMEPSPFYVVLCDFRVHVDEVDAIRLELHVVGEERSVVLECGNLCVRNMTFIVEDLTENLRATRNVAYHSCHILEKRGNVFKKIVP